MEDHAGRPPKAVVESNQRGKRKKRGRPPGQAAALEEFKARIMTSPKSRKVIDTILNAALNDEHPNQAAAWKLCMERLLPVSAFEKGNSGKAAVSITITGVGGVQSVQGEVIDHEPNE